MALDQISIINSALVKIGAEPIMALTDNSKEARLASIRFENAKKAVLRMHPWNFAIERVVTSPLTIVPPFGYSYYHQLPSDCLRILAVSPEDDLEYRIEGRKITTDSDSCELKYIADVEDLTLMDHICAEAIALYLAWDLAYPITQEFELKNQMWSDFQIILRKAKGVDAQEEPAPVMETETWLNSRENYTERPIRGDR